MLYSKQWSETDCTRLNIINKDARGCSVTHSHLVVSVLLFCHFAVLDAALDILAGKQGSSVFGSVGADV